MRFGMGILLTKEEEEILAPITKPCFAALGLANDFYSFDIEWKEFQEKLLHEKSPTMTSAVWLYMTWEGLSVTEAKHKTRLLVRRYEQSFQDQITPFIQGDERCSPKLSRYLNALTFQIPGNVAWSLRCPRYHPELGSEATELLKGSTDASKPAECTRSSSTMRDPVSPVSNDYVSEFSMSPRSSVGTAKSSQTSVSPRASISGAGNDFDCKHRVKLGAEVRAQSLQPLSDAVVDICYYPAFNCSL